MKQFKLNTIPKFYIYISLAVVLTTIGLVLWYVLPIIKPTQSMLTRIGAHTVLPRETPTIATISDKSKLATQPFFSEAQNGDVLLVYNKSKKAILYRPSIDKILNISSIHINATPQENSKTAQVSKHPDLSRTSLALYNGTSVVGFAARVQRELLKINPTIHVSLRSSTKGDYTENYIIDVSGKHTQEASYLANLLHGAVTPLPSGEKQPAADILVILGDVDTYK